MTIQLKRQIWRTDTCITCTAPWNSPRASPRPSELIIIRHQSQLWQIHMQASDLVRGMLTWLCRRTTAVRRIELHDNNQRCRRYRRRSWPYSALWYRCLRPPLLSPMPRLPGNRALWPTALVRQYTCWEDDDCWRESLRPHYPCRRHTVCIRPQRHLETNYITGENVCQSIVC